MKTKLVMESRENGGELVVKTVSALKKESDNSIIYKFIDEFGKSTIEIFKNSVIISREGAINNSLILKKGMTTPFDYDLGFISTSLDLFTKELDISENKLDAVYVLYQGGELVNNINLSIYEK